MTNRIKTIIFIVGALLVPATALGVGCGDDTECHEGDCDKGGGGGSGGDDGGGRGW
jgi:hypothetical protein